MVDGIQRGNWNRDLNVWRSYDAATDTWGKPISWEPVVNVASR